MKRLITITLSVLAGFVLALVFLGFTANVRAGATRIATQNGDTNGDGRIDVSDAVYVTCA